MGKILQIRPSLLHQLRDHFKVEAVIVSELLADKKNCCHSVLSKHSEAVERMRSPLAKGSVSHYVIENAAPFRSASLELASERLTCSFMKAERLKAIMCVPVYFDDACIGKISIMSSKVRIWSEKELVKLEAYADLASRLAAVRTEQSSKPSKLQIG